jgi:hypothetical protein
MREMQQSEAAAGVASPIRPRLAEQ